jgi:bifunctional non-homologous end joining protein LigD
MNDLLESLPDEAKEQLQQKDQPQWMDPMLATLTDKRFSDPDWIYERKLDGERCIAYRKDGKVHLMSRNQKELNIKYPELVEILEDQEQGDFIIDGEVVAFEGNKTSFAKLQDRMHVSSEEEARKSGIRVFYYIFDMLYLDGYNITAVSLRHRKSLIKQALDYQDPIRYLTHRNEEGEKYYHEACQKGWEGLIAKDATSKYAGTRSKNWLKFKCVNQQEFVIGGYTEPHGERIGFGALLIGYYKDDDLIYAGKVGTGYDDETLRRMKSKMQELERKTPPFSGEDLPDKEIHWVTPNLVGEVGFTEWTEDGKLRHPRFLGLRDDKDPQDVVREEPSA